MDEPKVYADITFIINLIMDFIVLWATAKLSGTRIIIPRLCAAAVLGAIYSVIFLYPAMAFCFSLPAKILFSVLILIIGLAPGSWKQFQKVFVYFYVISFAAAGASIAVSYMPGRELDSNYLWWLAGAVFAIVLGIYGEKHLLKKIIPDLLKFKVELKFGGNSCNGQGFLDTGNGLRDPLTNRPVVVAEYGLIRKCLPEDFRQVLDASRNENDMLEGLSNCSWASRLRIIPFSSIGRRNGIMVGIRADSLVLENGGSDLSHRNIVVGIYRDKLSHDGSYQMLVPSEIVNKG